MNFETRPALPEINEQPLPGIGEVPRLKASQRYRPQAAGDGAAQAGVPSNGDVVDALLNIANADILKQPVDPRLQQAYDRAAKGQSGMTTGPNVMSNGQLMAYMRANPGNDNVFQAGMKESSFFGDTPGDALVNMIVDAAGDGWAGLTGYNFARNQYYLPDEQYGARWRFSTLVVGSVMGPGLVVESGAAAEISNAANTSFGAGNRALGAEVSTISRNGSRVVIDQSYVSEIGNVACGPTSCAMIMNDRGQFVNISHLAQDAGLVPGIGTDVLGLSEALRQNGVSAARATFGTTIDDLAASTANGNAAIAHVNLTAGGKEVGHFVVVDGVTTRAGRTVVAIRDPSDGQFFVPADQFKTKFSGQAVLTNGPH